MSTEAAACAAPRRRHRRFTRSIHDFVGASGLERVKVEQAALLLAAGRPLEETSREADVFVRLAQEHPREGWLKSIDRQRLELLKEFAERLGPSQAESWLRVHHVEDEGTPCPIYHDEVSAEHLDIEMRRFR